MAATEYGSKESSFTNAKGKKIFCRYWCEDVENPRALVLICHGAAEHCLWYSPLAVQLKEAGCYVFGHDHVGHGQSEGARVHVDNFHEYVQDMFQHFDSVAEQFPGLPKYIIGHSMVFFGKIAAKVLPQVPVLFLNPDNTSRDPVVVNRYKNDPLVYHGGLKARWGASMLKWMEWMEKNMSSLKSPLLTLHGTNDKLTLCDGSRILVDKVSSTDKTLKIYEGYYHQLHNEPGEDGAGVRKEIVQWITAHIRS